MSEHITIEKRGAIARLALTQTLIGAPVIAAIADACEALAGDADVRAVILTGTGAMFAMGWDGAPPAGDPFGCLAELPKPVICALNGDALGAGLALALACDIRIAAKGARLGLPEAEEGQLPLGGAVARLTRLIGRGKALEMVLTGEPVDAAEALRVGLVSRVVSSAELPAEAEAIAARIAERGAVAVAYAKEAVRRGAEMPLEQALRYETDLTIILQTTEDRAEGVRAFLEKRSPKFKGK